MNKRTIVVSLVACAGLMVPTAAFATGNHGEGHTPVTICHNGHQITVDDDAVPAHVYHGDTVGPCAPASTPTPTEVPTSTPTPTPSTSSSSEPTPTQEPTSTPSTPPSQTPTPTTPSPTTTTDTSTGSPVMSPESPQSPTGTTSEIHTALASTGISTEAVWVAAGTIILGVYLWFIAASKRRKEENR